MAYCSKCGHQMADGAKFCPNCGAAQARRADTERRRNRRRIRRRSIRKPLRRRSIRQPLRQRSIRQPLRQRRSIRQPIWRQSLRRRLQRRFGAGAVTVRVFQKMSHALRRRQRTRKTEGILGIRLILCHFLCVRVFGGIDHRRYYRFPAVHVDRESCFFSVHRSIDLRGDTQAARHRQIRLVVSHRIRASHRRHLASHPAGD